MIQSIKHSLLLVICLVSPIAYSAPFVVIPDCLDYEGDILPIDNQSVLKAMRSTPNAYEMRARIKGVIGMVYPDRNDHDHFEAVIGTGVKDKIEIVFNQHFGELPELKPGMSIEVCGDYITSTAQTGAYPPSPNGAIIHYLHFSNSRNHQSGHVVINDAVYGHGSWNRPSKKPNRR